MASAARLHLDRRIRRRNALDGDETYPSGIFEFNVTRRLAYGGSARRLHVELVALDDIPTVAAARG